MPEPTRSAVDVTKAPLLQGAAHGFLGRSGGFSTGIYAGLNVGLGSDDDQDAIIKNRQQAKAAVLPNGELVTLYQVHSADVAIVTEPFAIDERPRVDAMVTDRPGLLLGILTADCVPVLFFDAAAQIVGAAHAGWKGAIGGVTDHIVAAMEELGASRDNIACAIGPCIAQESYEVDVGFQARFVEKDPENERYFAAGKAGHFQFDIESYVADRLTKAGVMKIDKLGLDTYANEERYYSYRRSCHRGEAGYGRQISLIGLRP
ncbi:peptidoglycan editing factor PgeF [Parasphingorhabdus cellanae]|uniref:Purine nucleoside phosphorylase n=1 Tax=Parasphingorhabdus cellanae TaxID=2806553 RepID=A0ABX7T949_9SPHN|nr:peptidoglycan editing factor PgeF [Parasphingorhabdus cellanae]QTD57513.1 peptidoglycan editing factor PgeF [Parasphingorhabdus cellanae]